VHKFETHPQAALTHHYSTIRAKWKTGFISQFQSKEFTVFPSRAVSREEGDRLMDLYKKVDVSRLVT
jgi:hypothetical protein